MAGVVAAFVLIALLSAAVPLDPAYLKFAPTHLFGIKHFAVTATNAAFLAVGLYGLRELARVAHLGPYEVLAYRVFFFGLILVAFGSGYFHLDPTPATLLWDRAAMTVVFSALVAAYLADRVAERAAVVFVMPVLIALGLASQFYFAAIHDDLRLYRLVQFRGIAVVVLIVWLFDGRRTTFRDTFWMALWFGLATATEHLDWRIQDIAGEPISGHAIKHVLASIAAIPLIATMRRSPEG